MEKVFKFEFTEQEVNMILTGLGELPAKQSYALLNKVQGEANKQLKTMKETKEPDAE